LVIVGVMFESSCRARVERVLTRTYHTYFASNQSPESLPQDARLKLESLIIGALQATLIADYVRSPQIREDVDALLAALKPTEGRRAPARA
jgi:hypothetical protein